MLTDEMSDYKVMEFPLQSWKTETVEEKNTNKNTEKFTHNYIGQNITTFWIQEHAVFW